MTNEFLKHQQELSQNFEFLSELKSKEVGAKIAFQIKAMREAANLNQGALARLLNTTQSRVSQMEDPEYGKFTLQSLYRVTEALGYELIVEIRKPNSAVPSIDFFSEDLGDKSFGNFEMYLAVHNRETATFSASALPEGAAGYDDVSAMNLQKSKATKNIAA